MILMRTQTKFKGTVEEGRRFSATGYLEQFYSWWPIAKTTRHRLVTDLSFSRSTHLRQSHQLSRWAATTNLEESNFNRIDTIARLTEDYSGTGIFHDTCNNTR